MAGKVRHLLNRDGRYFARLVVPAELRPYLANRSELRKALGPDRRVALALLPRAVSTLQHEIAVADRKRADATAQTPKAGRYPLTPEEIAQRSYVHRLAQDELARNAGHQWAGLSIDEGYVAQLRLGIAGRLRDVELDELVGARIRQFEAIGNTTAKIGSEDWRVLARALCISEYEALSRVAERDEGDFAGQPSHSIIADAKPIEDEKPPVWLRSLLDAYLKEREAGGTGQASRKRWTPVFEDLAQFIRHNDARKLTMQNLIDWKDTKLGTLSPKTISDVYLASVRTVLKWAVENNRLDKNVAADVRLRVAKPRRTREKGFTDSEAVAILKFVRAYKPTLQDNPANMELPQTTAAKRWTPFLSAFTGARISELTQLRKEDFRREGDDIVMRITPDAGTVKSGQYRDVPLHRQLVQLGFMEFVEASAEGPLFFPAKRRSASAIPAQTVSGRVTKWLQDSGLIPEGVGPSHGWRHRFKTVGQEEGVADRTLDAIQGHAGRTAGDNYGDVTIKAKARAIEKLPDYAL